ncbi:MULTISPECIES: hypothetical protein [unclassified Streptomyces]|nr:MULTISPECIES: hypothetical protein [unclassified Streptomyces]WSD28616.1 hypothetical protein OHA26_36980 [Streptomyces sp. NBC_01751]
MMTLHHLAARPLAGQVVQVRFVPGHAAIAVMPVRTTTVRVCGPGRDT